MKPVIGKGMEATTIHRRSGTLRSVLRPPLIKNCWSGNTHRPYPRPDSGPPERLPSFFSGPNKWANLFSSSSLRHNGVGHAFDQS